MVGKLIVKIMFAIAIGLYGNLQVQAELIEIETNTNIKAVYLIEDPVSDQIVVNPVFLAGELDFMGPEGLSHYLEHLMFWHADKAGGKEIHGRGGNAWVNGIVTSYYSNGILSEMGELFEFARRLLDVPDLDQKFMLDEKRVVEREFDFRISENPDRKLREQMRRKLFLDHPAGRSVIGNPESIRSLSLDHAYRFHRRYYIPANLVLLISGNLKPAQVREWVEKKFARIDAGKPNTQSWRVNQVFNKQDASINLKASNVDSDAFKYTAISQWAPKDGKISALYTAWLTQELLNSALKGSLSRPLRLDNFVASGLTAWLDTLIDEHAVFSFNARPDDGVTTTDLKNKFHTAVQLIAQNGAPKKSIKRIRKRMLREAIRLAEDPSYILRRSLALLRIGELPINSNEHIKQLNLITKEDIDELFRAIANPIRRVEGYLEKGKE